MRSITRSEAQQIVDSIGKDFTETQHIVSKPGISINAVVPHTRPVAVYANIVDSDELTVVMRIKSAELRPKGLALWNSEEDAGYLLIPIEEEKTADRAQTTLF